jgi:cytochrome P450
MNAHIPNYSRVAKPAHVPGDLVVDFDYFHPPGIDEGTVYTAWHRLHDGPDIVWTPHNGGHWILTRAEDIRWVQETHQSFSHEVFTIPRGASPVRMPPLTVDPPLHARYRAVLNPSFTPKRVQTLGEQVRALTVDLIEKLRPLGACEFVGQFARIMPVTIFLGIVDLPLDRRDEFVEWAVGYIDASDQPTKDRYLGKVVAFLREVLDARAAAPGDDLLSRIAGWRDNPRFGGEHEVIGMAMLVFFGGLDTVANMLSFTAWHLAKHPELHRRLRDDPSIAGRAAEEYIRRHGLSNTGRLVKHDVAYKGVTFKADEMVMVPISMSSMDDRLHADPLTVDFDRETPAHDTFGNGPHKCVGAPLARSELRIFLEEWTQRMPPVRLAPGHRPRSHSGSVNGVSSLHLEWDI